MNKNTDTSSMGEREILQHLMERVDKMYTYLCGDEEGGVTGLVERVRILEQKVQDFERLKWKMVGIGTILLPVVLFIWEMVKRWIEAKV